MTIGPVVRGSGSDVTALPGGVNVKLSTAKPKKLFVLATDTYPETLLGFVARR